MSSLETVESMTDSELDQLRDRDFGVLERKVKAEDAKNVKDEDDRVAKHQDVFCPYSVLEIQQQIRAREFRVLVSYMRRPGEAVAKRQTVSKTCNANMLSES